MSALSTRRGRISVTMRRNSSLSCCTVFCRPASSSDGPGCDVCQLAAQNVELDIQAQKRLQDAVVQIA